MQKPSSLSGSQPKLYPCPICRHLNLIETNACKSCKRNLTFCLTEVKLVQVDSKRCSACQQSFAICPHCSRLIHANSNPCQYCRHLLPQFDGVTGSIASKESTAPLPGVAHLSTGHIEQAGMATVPVAQSQAKVAQVPFTSNISTGQLAPEQVEHDRQVGQESYAVAAEGKKDLASLLTLTQIEKNLGELRQGLQDGSAERYFPGNDEDREKILRRWSDEIDQVIALVRLVRKSQLSQLHELEIRKNLTEVVDQLEYRRPYEVKLVGHTGAGKTTILAAMLGEDFFPIWSGDTVTGARTRIRFSDTDQDMMYIHFIDEKRQMESYERKDWQKIALKYIAQPQVGKKNSAGVLQAPEPNESDQVEFVEVVLNTKTHPLLPPNSMIVDLPGGRAGVKVHDDILDKELKRVDAVILFAGGERYRSDQVTSIFQDVREKVTAGRDETNVTRMIFLVATHWDGKSSKVQSLEASVNAMRTLAEDALGASYVSNHRHGPKEEYPFYPIRGQDAFFAAMYQKGEPLSEELQKGAQEYLGRVWALRAELRELVPALPELQSPADAGLEHHQAMWEYSGLPQLIRDIHSFLANSRFEVQLDRVREQLQKAFGRLEDVSWSHIEQYVSPLSRDLDSLRDALKTHAEEQENQIKLQLKQRIERVEKAWNEALNACALALDRQINLNTAFMQELQEAHKQAKKHVKARIQQGYFNQYFDLHQRTSKDAGGLPTDTLKRTVYLKPLLSNLRASFRVAIEKEMRRPSITLARAFLDPLHEKERAGVLDIDDVFSGLLDKNSEIFSKYQNIKVKIKSNAQEACLSITVSVLLGDKCALDNGKPSVAKLVEYVETNLTLKDLDLLQGTYPLIENILDEMVQPLVMDTEAAILTFFLYELDKLLKYEELYYSGSSQSASFQNRDGDFSDLLAEMRVKMDHLRNTDEMKRSVLSLLNKNQPQIDRWENIIKELESIKSMHPSRGRDNVVEGVLR